MADAEDLKGPRADDFGLLKALEGHAKNRPDALCMCEWSDGPVNGFTYESIWDRASRVAGALIDHGVGPGDRVAILAPSSPQWVLILLACFRANAIAVPIDVSMETDEINEIIRHCDARVLFTTKSFVESASLENLIGSNLEHIVLTEIVEGDSAYPTLQTFAGWRPISGDHAVEQDVALIVYTSGTMGTPKGTVISYAAIDFQAARLHRLFKVSTNDRFGSMLPLNHVFGLSSVVLLALKSGASVVFCDPRSTNALQAAISDFGVTILVCVPILLSVIRNNIQEHIRKAENIKKYYYHFSQFLCLVFPIRLIRRLLCSQVHKRIGPRLRIVATGGAAVEPNLLVYFERLGVPVFQGYGMTETTSVITVNSPNANRTGSVGRPLDGVEIRIDLTAVENDDEGEVLTRGTHVMKSYYKDPEQTRAALDDDGWLRTGDIGKLDPDGFLHITGRIKNLVVLDSGKNVSPEEVEFALLESAKIKECCVVGRPRTTGPIPRREELCAVVVPEDSVVETFDARSEDLIDEVRREVTRASRGLASHKRPVSVVVSLSKFPLTRMQKVARRIVAAEVSDPNREHFVEFGNDKAGAVGAAEILDDRS